MKIEIDENTGFTTAFVAVITAIAIISTYGCHQSEETEREKVKAGLVQEIAPGAISPIWTNPKPE